VGRWLFYIIAQWHRGHRWRPILWRKLPSGIPEYSIAKNGLGQNGLVFTHPPDIPWQALSLPSCLDREFLFVIFGSTHKNAPQGFAGVSMDFL